MLSENGKRKAELNKRGGSKTVEFAESEKIFRFNTARENI